MTANSDRSKQNNKAAHRVLAGVLCGASVLSLVLSLVMPPISQAIANETQTVSTEGTVMGGGSSSDSAAAVGNTSEDAEKQNGDETDDDEAGSSNSVEQAQSANAASEGATATVKPGIYVPTSIGIGTNINISTPDPGVATYVGRDMYIGGKPIDPSTLDAEKAPAGSYAVEAEGLTVVRGKLAMNPIKNSWSGDGFRFGTVGFGSQFRPVDRSTVLAVAGIGSAITSMSVGYSGNTPRATTVGAWTKGAWVGKATKTDSPPGYDYTAQIAGPITYWKDNDRRQSVVTKQGNWYEGDSSTESTLFNKTAALTVNGKDYTNFLESEVKAKISTPLAKLAKTGEYTIDVAEPTKPNSNYTIQKYNNTDNRPKYGLTFDNSNKTFERKTSYTDVNGNDVSGQVTLVNNEKLITFTGDADDNGNGSSLQVFYLKASDLTNSIGVNTYRGVDFSFNKIPVGASVVVNIVDEGGQTATPVEFNTGWRFWWNGREISRGYEEGSDLESLYSTAAQSILWNFTTASQVTIRGGMALEGIGGDGKWTDDDPAAAMLGSIVVPNGSFEDHVTTNGRVYVGGDFQMYNHTVAYRFNEGESASVIDMDQERHNFPWSGSYTPGGSAIAWSKVDAADGITPLAGSEWAIYATEADAENNQNRIVSIVDNGTNDFDPTVGTIQFNHLNQKAKVGDSGDTNYFTYYIREVKAPEGYELSNTIYTSKMFHTGDELNLVGNVDANGNEISKPQSVISNAKITGSVSWTKVEEDDAKHAPLAGSEWKLAKLGADGSTEVQSWTVIDRSTSGDATWADATWADTDATPGKFKLEGLLPGTYTLVETQAPFGYNLNTTRYEFAVNTDGSITWDKDKKPTIDAGGNVYISDSPTTTSVQIPVTKSVRNTDWPKDVNGYVPFKFEITAEASSPAAPMPPSATPSSATLTVAPKAGETDTSKLNNITAAFGAMTFNKSHLADTAGDNGDYAKTYTYTVKEVAPTTGAVDRLRYSKAEYQVAVTVKADMTNGKYTGLTTSTTVTQMKDDMGNALGENGQGVKVQPSAAAPDAIPASTFTNTYSTSLPLSGMSGVTLTYFAGAAVLCAAAAWMHIRRKANAKGGERRE